MFICLIVAELYQQFILGFLAFSADYIISMRRFLINIVTFCTVIFLHCSFLSVFYLVPLCDMGHVV